MKSTLVQISFYWKGADSLQTKQHRLEQVHEVEVQHNVAAHEAIVQS